MFECTANTHTRLDPRYSSLFVSVVHGDLKRVFNSQNTSAGFVSDVTAFLQDHSLEQHVAVSSVRSRHSCM